VNSIRKNNTDQNWAPGNWFIASVNIMKANPVPEADWNRNEQLLRLVDNGDARHVELLGVKDGRGGRFQTDTVMWKLEGVSAARSIVSR
jgi:hypothetical protein